MPPIDAIVRRIIALQAQGQHITLLAVCPNSDAVLEASVRVAADNDMPMLFAATLNQVDRDGGYTGWTPAAFVGRMRQLAAQTGCASPLYPCLDHGGPWLKDRHTVERLGLEQTMAEVRASLSACLEAGYVLLHIDPTVDRTLRAGTPPAIEIVVERSIELIAHAEAERKRLGLPGVSYEVGTEEVHGGLADLAAFDRFLSSLRSGLEAAGLGHVWPCFIVGKVGTDLHTTVFDRETAVRLTARVAPLGSLIKGHYTDWVSDPTEYPSTGMGAANVGPEFTSAELEAVRALCAREASLVSAATDRSGLERELEAAVVTSGRWRKWLLPEEDGKLFEALDEQRRTWLVATGARYVWSAARVREARRRLYTNVAGAMPDPHGFVVDRIAAHIQKYVDAFNLKGSLRLLAA